MAEPSLEDPTLERKLNGHKDAVSALCFSPTDDQIVSSSLDTSIMLWKLGNPMRSYKFDGHQNAVLDVVYSPSGKWIASASRDRSVRLWRPSITGNTQEFRAHSQTVRSVQFTSDNVKLITASDDKTIKLWSVARLKFISSFVGHNNWVRCARLSNDDSAIASCSDDKTMKLWDIDSGECVHTFNEPKGSGVHLAWHPTGCYIALGLSNGTVKVYDTRTHAILQHYRAHEGTTVNQLAFHPNGTYLLTSSKDGTMKVMDLMEGHPMYTLSGHKGSVTTVAFSTNGDYFATGGDDKQVLIWKTNFADAKNNMKENTDRNYTPSTSSKCAFGSKFDEQGGLVVGGCKNGIKNHIFLHYHVSSEENLQSPQESSSRTNVLHDIEPLNSVGDLNQIPRPPPTPKKCAIPIAPKCNENESLMGVISLENDEVCYTSGKIQWVGKKTALMKQDGPYFSSYLETHDLKKHIFENSFFKTHNKCVGVSTSESLDLIPAKTTEGDSPNKLVITCNKCVGTSDCECTDLIPTINTIVDHLNTLHETIQLVDERLELVESELKSR